MEDDGFLAGFGLGLLLAVFSGFMFHDAGVSSVRQEAVDSGHAEYDSKTRDFKWLPVAEKDNSDD